MSQNKHKTLVSNNKKIAELADAISVYADVQLSPEEYGETQNLRDKLDFVLMGLEEQGQLAKIKTMKKILEIMKKAKINSIV